MSFKLVVLNGPLFPSIFELKKDRYVIGRKDNCDICFPDKEVSSEHCFLIERPHGGYKIRDNNSSNGTFVNGDAIVEEGLKYGDIIRIGHSEIDYTSDNPDDKHEYKTVRAIENLSQTKGIEDLTHLVNYNLKGKRNNPVTAKVWVLILGLLAILIIGLICFVFFTNKSINLDDGENENVNQTNIINKIKEK